MAGASEYRLSAVLVAHALDVRCVAAGKEDCVLSASRDKTARLWHPEGVKDFTNVVTYTGHKNFVSSVVWMPPCEAHPEGLVLTGSNDNTILGYYLQDGTVVLTLQGHENAVSNLSCGRVPGTILSASWDNTARIWNVNTPQATPTCLKGHQAAVWAVVELCNGTFVTASADKTIIMWSKQAAKLRTLTGHKDCVRGLAVASEESFLSCSNDATIKLWNNLGDCLNTYYGHSNYIYSVCMNPSLPGGCFVSCGEDSTVRVWQAGDNVRTITLPTQSVWSVACLSNGDIITGSSDGMVRVFSANPSRYADDAVLAAFEAEVLKLQSAAKQEIGGFKLSELPGPEVLFEPGKTDGQTKLVRRGDTVKAYSWSAAAQSWTEIGDVTGSVPATEGKTLYQGKEYDFVFSVDIEDGAPPLKLPYNKGEDPWVSAQAFIHKNQLPQVYLDQVANFIVTNAKIDQLPPSSNGMEDPFTGGSRYVPGSNSGAPASVPSAAAPDPFTGSGAYTTQAAQAAATAKSLIPHRDYLRFDQANLAQILEKVKELNQKVGDGASALGPDQLDAVVKLAEQNAAVTPDSISNLKKLLEWPRDVLFPVLDITRLAVRNKDVNAQMFDDATGPTFINFLITLLAPGNLAANQMLSLRVLVNAFVHLPGEMMVLAAQESIVHALICMTELNKNAQIAASTLLLNLSVALAQHGETGELADCLIQLINKLTDNEACFRALVALGTLVAESPNKLQIQSKIVSNVQLHNKLKQSSENPNSPDPNIRKIILCSHQIVQLL